MADQTPIRDYMLPRVSDLVRGAVAQGMDRDAVVAVLIDIASSPGFDTATPTPTTDIRPDWVRSDPKIVQVTEDVTANVRSVGVQAEDDFIAPLTTRD
jgi:hypothetical protein